MRIIAGLYRGRVLTGPPSSEVRPTSDRLRETLFNILGDRLVDSRFLDLCAGSGAVGIEALSRGAVHTTFVDRSRKMCLLVEKNLRSLQIDASQYLVVSADASDFVRSARERAWDLVYFDPPYKDDYLPVHELLGAEKRERLSENGLVIVEHFHKNKLPEEIQRLARVRLVKQGDSCLSFYTAYN